MAFTKVLSDISPTVVKIGGGGTPVGGTDDLRTTGSPVKFTVNTTFIELDEHRDTFTQDTSIPARRFWDVTYQFWMQGSGSLGTVAINGFAAIDATLRMAAMTSAAGAGTSIIWTPSTIATLEAGVVWAENQGLLHKADFAIGNVVMEGSPDSGMRVTFTGLGDYAVPTVASISGFTGGTSRAEAHLDISGTITPDGGSAYTPRVSSTRWDRGVQTATVIDANDATGVDSNFVRRARPIMNIVIAADADGSAALDYPDIFNNMLARTVHDVNYRQGTVAGNIVTFDVPRAQVVGHRMQEGDGYITLSLDYRQTHTTDETEFSITNT